MGKYAGNCVELFHRPENPPRPGKSPVMMFGDKYFQDAKHWVEIITVTGNFMMYEGLDKGRQALIHIGPDGHRGGPYPKTILNADKLMFFYGINPENMEDLGAHVEIHLGKDENARVLEFDSPRCVFIPRETRYGPIYVTKFRQNLIIFDVLTAPSKGAAVFVTDFDYIADKVKTREVIGDQQEAYDLHYSV